MSFQTNNNIFLIIPAYNEKAEVLQQTADELLKASYNIIIIDDGSVKPVTLSHQSAAFYLLRHKVNLGQGAALQTGIEFALSKGAKYLVTFDSDGQHSVKDIPAMISPLIKGQADLTLASRFLQPGHHNATASKQFLLKSGRWVNYFFTGLFLSDAHNGLRAMTSKTAEKINIKENRMAHATEILFAIRKYNLKYIEVPASITYTDYSKAKGQSVFNSIRIFFDLVLHKLFE